MMKMYLVGGAVRDKLMNVEPSDYDYVIVGSSIDEMINLGFSFFSVRNKSNLGSLRKRLIASNINLFIFFKY